MTHRSQLLAAMAMALLTQGAYAAVTADEAKQLGGDKLTEFGAERAGNKEGTIPPYSGKAPKAPASYDRKDPGQRPSPYAGEKPLFSITAQNADQYADKLDAMRELFKRYPTFRMDVYPSHRDIEYPKYVLENSVKNATSCKATANELKLEGCYGGVPFPIPKTGNQVMWNHLLPFVGHAYEGIVNSYVTPPNGKAVLNSQSYVFQQYDFFDPKNTKPNASDQIFWKDFTEDRAPARKVGNLLILLDNLDMVDKGRRVYQYVPGQRRVKLAPNLAYDTPSPTSGGVGTMDDAKAFIGALDRFDFKLIGKREKYIPYNTFELTQNKTCSDEKLVDFKNFANPDCVRWELHRVWVVEATLKSSFRHVYSKRAFYWDEDFAGAGTAEAYDAAGKLYRIVYQAAFPFYADQLGASADTSVQIDLQSGAWAIQGSMSGEKTGWWKAEPWPDRKWTPEALAAEGVR